MKSAAPISHSQHDRDVSADSAQWRREISAGRDSARPPPAPGCRGGGTAAGAGCAGTARAHGACGLAAGTAVPGA